MRAIRSLTTRVCSTRDSMIDCASSSWFVLLTNFTLRFYNIMGSDPTAADHRQGRNFSHHLFFAVLNPNLSAFFEIIVLQIRERNLAIQARRKGQRSEVSNLFMIIRDDFSVLLKRPGDFQYHPGQFFRHVPAMLDPDDYFLADIAALCVADRIVEISFRDYGILAHVDAETRNAGFDSQDFESLIC